MLCNLCYKAISVYSGQSYATHSSPVGGGNFQTAINSKDEDAIFLEKSIWSVFSAKTVPYSKKNSSFTPFINCKL